MIGDRYYYVSTAPAPYHVAHAGAFVLELMAAANLSTANLYYLQLYQSLFQPLPGAFPSWEVLIGKTGVAAYTPSRMSRRFANGLTIALSSTPGLYTAILTNDLIVTVEGTSQVP